MAAPPGSAAYVRLTAPAVEDMERLLRSDPQIVRMVLKKMLLLERNPQAGRPLSGSLRTWRKLTVRDRDWRIIWRVTNDDPGTTVIDIAEVWAAGARADLEVYDEMKKRIAALEDHPATTALSEVVQLLGTATGTVSAAPEPVAPPPVPHWLASRLAEQAGMSEEEIAALTPEQAMDRWEAFITRER